MKKIFIPTQSFKILLLIFTMTAVFTVVKAQQAGNSQALLEPSGTQYFQNQYLANPAMAGIDSGLHINGAYRRQWTGIDGAPVTGYFTADGFITNRVGAGLHIFNDKAGLINRTRIAGTYAYRIPLDNNGRQLHFGLSLAMNFQRLDYSHVTGDPNDPSLSAFNRRDNYFEAEYGMAYTDAHWTLQGALPNVRSLFTGDNKGVDGGGIFFTAASYRFIQEGAISSVAPKLCYRGVKGYDNILDAGVNVGFLDNVANVMAMYHTSGSVTAGIGVNIKKMVTVQALYTTQTEGIKTYVDGSYEIGATVNLFR
ncbi:PorP/SprF family type IX secretion system membrane protein [Chitinophaga tropicalis]|uniref:Type IX secretion system membrane protein PorP/SprF n=1 Tax=Chitinophaga tropicalis TaxID=2683588 RepID=A0A7K1U1F9_9BACT|nr:PorP/SprF family type IX secretion system membrane protein [Chitinophaga tropicalis]MVT08173.1 type IX secretion system membrane protein PorP/SprF [Chitinophaga tropicalis]